MASDTGIKTQTRSHEFAVMSILHMGEANLLAGCSGFNRDLMNDILTDLVENETVKCQDRVYSLNIITSAPNWSAARMR